MKQVPLHCSLSTDRLLFVSQRTQIRLDAALTGFSRRIFAVCRTLMNKTRLIDQPERPPPLAQQMILKWTHQSGVESGWVGAVGEVVGVVLAGGGRCGVRWAVHSQRCVQLRPAARQEPVLVGRTAEGGSGGGSGGLGAACPVRDRPGNRIAASRTGVCRHEKLHEENRG